MLRGTGLLLVGLLGIHGIPAHAETFESAVPQATSRVDLPERGPGLLGLHGTLAARTFFRSEDLSWNIAGGAVNIISELEWERVRSAGVSFEGQLDLPHAWTLRGALDYGRILAGEIRDSDYNGSNRTLEFSRSISQTERGSVWDVALALGWTRPLGARFTMTPLVGLSYHQQNYNIRDGVQIIPPTGSAPLAGLDSDFDSEWYGFFWGAELRMQISEQCEALARFVSHHTAYRGEGRFNLRTDLGDPSFTHSTVAEGSTFRVGLAYDLRDAWTLELLALYRDWESDSGRTTFRLAAGGSSRQRLNDVELRSGSVSLGLRYAF